MTSRGAVVYHQALPEDFFVRLHEAVAAKPVEVFFRADDIGKVDSVFIRMMELFDQYQVPLCLAVVPEWMTAEHWQAMARFSPNEDLWCWHQHGYAHENHEAVGKKNEFGESRSGDEIRRDLQAGKERLAALLGDTFYPVFTPPWNRCSRTTLGLLSELGFQAVSRSSGVQPKADLPDLCVNVDLHTGKERDVQQATERLLLECQQGVEKGRLGIMLHHQRMNSRAFSFLERLLQILLKQEAVTFCTFRELLGVRS